MVTATATAATTTTTADATDARRVAARLAAWLEELDVECTVSVSDTAAVTVTLRPGAAAELLERLFALDPP